MAKLTVHDSSEKAAVEKVVEVKKDEATDAKGRVIKIRELGPLEESRIILAIGAEASVNMAYLNAYVMPAAKVESIDGDVYPLPQTKAQIEGMLTILGKDGMAAVLDLMYPRAQDGDSAMESAAKN
jgi:hypothetical protein